MTVSPGMSTGQKRIRVVIVDDSAVIRAVINRTLSGNSEIEVVGTAMNGEAGVKAVKQLQPDIVVLDIEMPIMDGLTALPLMLKEKPDVRIIICSTLSARGADVSIRALTLGATECILKPGGESISSAQDFQNTLVRTVRSIGAGIRPKRQAGSAVVPSAPTNTTPIVLKPASLTALSPRVLAIGSSTGGPRTLMEVLKGMTNLPVPIVITQHMPKTFTTLLAQHIQQACGFPCSEGEEGMVLKPGCAYVAPGGFHMLFKQKGSDVVIHIDEGPPESFCRPSVNPMLRSLISIYGARILSVILTGMGSDGLEGCQQVVAQGGQVIAQDEETSVVWGMPGAVANAGICTAVLPTPAIQAWIRQAIEGKPMRSSQL